jgi:hypothetical protein
VPYVTALIGISRLKSGIFPLFEEGIAMSKQKKKMGAILLLLGTVVGAYCIRTATHTGSNISTGAMRTALPQKVVQMPGVLPIPVIDYAD